MPRLIDSRLNDRIDALEARYGRARLVREIGAAVLRMRLTSRLLQSELGEKVRTSQASIPKLERGATALPHWDALEIIANNLRWEVVLNPGPKPVQVRKRR
jgi:DNA-binding XRE family transcriptional regulator